MDAKEFFFRAALVLAFIVFVVYSIVLFIVDVSLDEMEVMRTMKVYLFIGFYFLMFYPYCNSVGTRYLTPQNTFWILPYSKTWCIGYFIKCAIKWKPTIFTILLFVAPELFLPFTLKDKLIDIFVYLVLFFSFIVFFASLWHTVYDKKRIKDFNGLLMIPAMLPVLCTGIKFIVSLWYFFAGLVAFCLVGATFLYIRRYQFCK